MSEKTIKIGRVERENQSIDTGDRRRDLREVMYSERTRGGQPPKKAPSLDDYDRASGRD